MTREGRRPAREDGYKNHMRCASLPITFLPPLVTCSLAPTSTAQNTHDRPPSRSSQRLVEAQPGQHPPRLSLHQPIVDARHQVFLIVFFWLWRISNGAPDGPRIFYIRRINRFLSQSPHRACNAHSQAACSPERYTPWQIIVSTLTIIYGARHLDSILGVGCRRRFPSLHSRLELITFPRRQPPNRWHDLWVMPPAPRQPPPLNSLSSTAVPITAQPGSSRDLMPVCRLSPFTTAHLTI